MSVNDLRNKVLLQPFASMQAGPVYDLRTRWLLQYIHNYPYYPRIEVKGDVQTAVLQYCLTLSDPYGMEYINGAPQLHSLSRHSPQYSGLFAICFMLTFSSMALPRLNAELVIPDDPRVTVYPNDTTAVWLSN
jgi:hypothetical protein